MLVRFLFPSPKANKQLRPDLPLGVDDIDNVAARGVIASGLGEQLKYSGYQQRLQLLSQVRTAQEAARVTWTNTFSEISGRHSVQARCSRPGCSSLAFDGPANSSLENITFVHSCGAGASEKIPASCAAQYRKVKGSEPPKTNLSPSELAYALAASTTRTRADFEAEEAVAAARARFEDVDSRQPGQIPYGKANYLPAIDRPYDLPKRK